MRVLAGSSLAICLKNSNNAFARPHRARRGCYEV